MEKYKMAIVGATGLVGQTILKVLKEEDLFDKFQIHLYVSSRSAGKEYLWFGRTFRLVELSQKALEQNYDVVLFSAGTEVSKVWVQKFAESGSYVIDNTNAFRRCEDVPLVVPEINGGLINKTTNIISNPNCSTIELAIVVDKLRRLSKVNKIIVSTYQSVSGAGRKGLYDLKNNAKNVFKCGINGNIIAKIGDFDKKGYSTEENKLMFELSKILNEKIDTLATAVRVPIEFCHGESVYVQFETDVEIEKAKKELECDYIKVAKDDLFYPTEVAGTNDTYVCRMRQPSKKELQFFVFADNLRRGAAYNAVMILKILYNSRFYK